MPNANNNQNDQSRQKQNQNQNQNEPGQPDQRDQMGRQPNGKDIEDDKNLSVGKEHDDPPKDDDDDLETPARKRP